MLLMLLEWSDYRGVLPLCCGEPSKPLSSQQRLLPGGYFRVNTTPGLHA